MRAIRQISWPDLEALLELLRRLLGVILVWSFDAHDVVISLFRSGCRSSSSGETRRKSSPSF
jgi:hypothetical protein